MSTIRLHAGAELHNMSPDEFRQILREESAAERRAVRAEKWMRIPETLAGFASGNAILLDSRVAVVGPRQGYKWAVRRLLIDGLTTGSTPDVVNIFRNDNTNGAPLWQFNGNNFGYGWGKGEQTLDGGEFFVLQNVGSIAATGRIRLSGDVIEVPSEMLMKYYA